MDSSAGHSAVNLQYKFSWYIGYSIIALSFIYIAQENTLSQCLQIQSFYSDVVFAFAATFFTAVYLKKLDKYLNVAHPLTAGIKKRIGRQILLGILAPALVAMILETCYLYAIDISFADSSILDLELPLSLLFLTIVNLLYFSINLYRLSQAKQIAARDEAGAVCGSAPDHIIVQSGAREERVELEDCAYLYSSSKVVWLQTFSGEQYRVKGTLEYWEEQLSHANFLRINRQYLSAPRAIVSVEQTETRKLKVNFVIQPPGEVFISKTNAARFRQWWETQGPF